MAAVRRLFAANFQQNEVVPDTEADNAGYHHVAKNAAKPLAIGLSSEEENIARVTASQVANGAAPEEESSPAVGTSSGARRNRRRSSLTGLLVSMDSAEPSAPSKVAVPIIDQVMNRTKPANDDGTDYSASLGNILCCRNVWNTNDTDSDEGENNEKTVAVRVLLKQAESHLYINPDWISKKCWDLFLLLLVLYVSYFTLFEICFIDTFGAQLFESRHPGSRTLLRVKHVMDWITDISFCVDLLVNFRTTDLSPDGRMVKAPKEIFIRYVSGWFVVDLVSAIPVHRFDIGPNWSLFVFAKIFRLFRLGRLFKTLDEMGNANFARIVRMLMIFALIAHWVSVCPVFGT
jgi:hypothetical protein